MLEAAIQKGELGEGGYETWILLGETRNMDEREEAGMRALMYGVRIAEENGAAGAGMLVGFSLCVVSKIVLIVIYFSPLQSHSPTNLTIGPRIRRF